MKKYLVVSIMFFLFVFLASCSDDLVQIPITGNSSAQALLSTLTEIGKTMDVIAQTATAYSFTLTPTPVPTNTPDAPEVNKTIKNSINNQLISTFGARITVEDVKFGPIGAKEYTNLYIEIRCVGDNSTACPTNNVIIAVINACAEKKKKITENLPSTTQVLTITIFDPASRIKVAEMKWADVLAYLDGNVPGEVFNSLITYTEY